MAFVRGATPAARYLHQANERRGYWHADSLPDTTAFAASVCVSGVCARAIPHRRENRESMPKLTNGPAPSTNGCGTCHSQLPQPCEMKTRIVNHIVRILQLIRQFFYSAISTGHTKGSAKKIQPTLILGNGTVEFEKNVKLGYFPSPFFLTGYVHLEARGNNSSIIFGEDSKINNNFVAISEHKTITIGRRCLIGTNVEIYDSDFHGIRIQDRRISDPKNSKSVMIGDDVFIGSNVKIMKGVAIGNGSVIANGSIVVSEIPQSVIAGGNPARVLKSIDK